MSERLTKAELEAERTEYLKRTKKLTASEGQVAQERYERMRPIAVGKATRSKE